jgi:hypothetical protein
MPPQNRLKAVAAQRNFFSICFDLTGPRRARFSPAWDVLPFYGLIHFTQTTNRLPGRSINNRRSHQAA